MNMKLWALVGFTILLSTYTFAEIASSPAETSPAPTADGTDTNSTTTADGTDTNSTTTANGTDTNSTTTANGTDAATADGSITSAPTAAPTIDCKEQSYLILYFFMVLIFRINGKMNVID